jgi:hypothetical protein
MSTKLENAHLPKEHSVSCRVDNPAQCHEQSLNKFGRGFYSYKHNGAIYQQNGMYQVKPENGLRVYQQRPFLTPEFYDAGCSSLTCRNNDANYPSGHSCNGPISRGDPETNQMLDHYFQSTDPYQSNSVPVSICGIKGTSPDSTCGWIDVSTEDGKERPLWLVEAQARGEMFPCNGKNKYPHNGNYKY